MGTVNDAREDSVKKAIRLARIILDENPGDVIKLQVTPFMAMDELILGFVQLGCEVEPTSSRRVVTVRRRKDWRT